MSQMLSLKLRDDIFRETEEILQKHRRPRNAYINEAIHWYNQLWKRKLLKAALTKESALVTADSLEILEVLEQLRISCRSDADSQVGSLLG